MRAQTQLAGHHRTAVFGDRLARPRGHIRALPVRLDAEVSYYLPSRRRASTSLKLLVANVQQFLAHLNGTNIKELVANVNKLTRDPEQESRRAAGRRALLRMLHGGAPHGLRARHSTTLKRLLTKPDIGRDVAQSRRGLRPARKFADSGRNRSDGEEHRRRCTAPRRRRRRQPVRFASDRCVRDLRSTCRQPAHAVRRRSALSGQGARIRRSRPKLQFQESRNEQASHLGRLRCTDPRRACAIGKADPASRPPTSFGADAACIKVRTAARQR